MYSSGTTTSTFMMGSRRTGEALWQASLNAIEPAILNAISELSTSCELPSISTAATSTMVKPARMPLSNASRMPASIGAMNSRGIDPPTILSINRNRCSLSNFHFPAGPPTICLARASRSSVDISFMFSWLELGSGCNSISQCPYWPRPPVCLMYLPSAVAFLRIVSRYATCGRPTLACTLYSRSMRSTIISRCNSPMPEISVCPVSGSVETRNVGSSCASRCMATPSLSWSAFLVAERVAGIHALQAHTGANIAGVNGVDFLALVGVHLQQAADALARAFSRIHHVASGFQHARINANIRHVSDERVGHNLERQRRKRLIVRRPPKNGFIRRGIRALHRRNVQRRRQIIHYRVQQRLNAFVLERRTRQHRHNFQRQGRFPDRLAHFFESQRHAIQILLDQLVVMLGDIFHNFIAVLVVEFLVDRRGFQRRSHIRPRIHKRLVPKLPHFEDFKFCAQRLFQPDNDLFLEEIYNPDEIIFAAERELQRNGVGSQTFANSANHMVEISAHAVHFVHETDARDAVLVRL